VSLLAELERELLRLRAELSARQWKTFCCDFPGWRIFDILRLGTLSLRRLKDSRSAFPSDAFHLVMRDSFPARPTRVPSPAHIVSAWEFSLPASRSVRARKAYFSREIAETIRTTVKPRILILGGGRLRAADEAIQASHQHHAEFVALDFPSAPICHPPTFDQDVRREAGGWADLPGLSGKLGRFDLIYSASWLDSTADAQATEWLGAAVEMLRAGGRVLAANFAPLSRDVGWMEACWNWHPYYRSAEQLARLVMDFKYPGIRGHAVFQDESGASAYLEIHSI
jgi:hypothetical protein